MPHRTLLRNLEESIQAKQLMLKDTACMEAFTACCDLVLQCYRNGGRLYICGNGGSAADAQHLAAEFVGRLASDRAPLPAEALTIDSSVLTAISNDYGFGKVFSRQVYAKLRPDDLLLGITTSGNSDNIRQALQACRKIGNQSIIFTGKGGGEIAKNREADILVSVPVEKTSTIQELHITLHHSLCEYIESSLFPIQDETPDANLVE